MATLRNKTLRSSQLFSVPPGWSWILNGSWELADGTALVAELVQNQNTGIYCLWDGLSFIYVGAKLIT